MEIAEKRTARLAYLKAYRQAHAERISAQKKEWYAEHKAYCNAKSQANYLANAPQRVEANKRWLQAHPEKPAAYAKQFKARHPEKVAAERRAYKQANKGVINATTRRRQAAKMNRTPAWLTDDDLWLMQQAYELAQLRSTLFGFPWHVDHIYPLQGRRVSGLHVPTNLQVIPGADNCRKSNKVYGDC